METHAARARLERLLRDVPVRVGTDDTGGLLVFVRRDLWHLDADALNDRLHAWAARVLQPRLVGASAFVSFRHAVPATRDEASLDVQETWLGLEPTMRLETALPAVGEREVDAFAASVPTFLRLVDATGRPEAWRDVEEGNAE